MMSENKNTIISKRLILFILIYSVIQISFLLYQIDRENYFTKDSYEYLNYAKNLKTSGIGYCGDLSQKRDPLLYTKRTPGYPIFMNLVSNLNESFVFLILMQSFLSVLFAVFIYMFFKSRFRESTILPILLSAYILQPSQFIYPTLIMTESLFQISISGSFFAFLIYMHSRKSTYFLLSMIFLFISVIIKPVASIISIAIIPIAIVFILREKLSRVLIAVALIPFLAVLILSAGNYGRTKSLSVSSVGSINIMRYYTYMFLKGEKGDLYADRFLDECTSYKDSSNQAGKIEKFYINRSLAEIKKQPIQFLLFNIKGWINYFLDFGRYDLNQIIKGNNHESDGLLVKYSKGGYSALIDYIRGLNPLVAVSYILMIFFNLINLLSLCFYLFFCNDNRYAKTLCAIYIFSIMLATSAIGASRFRQPIFPIMIYAMIFNFNALFLDKKKKISREG